MADVKITYQELLDLIEKNVGKNAVYEVEREGIQATNFPKFLEYCQHAGVNVTYNNNNQVLGYSVQQIVDRSSPTGKIGELANSNVASGTASETASALFNGAVDTGTTAENTIKASSNFTKYTGGTAGSLAKSVIGKIGTGLMIGSTAIQLGKIIDGGVYHIGKALGANPPSELDPSTWNSIIESLPDTDTGNLEKWAFRTILDIDDDGNANMYIDEDVLAYASLWLQQQGFFNSGGISLPSQTINSNTIPKVTIHEVTLPSTDSLTDSNGNVYSDGAYTGPFSRWVVNNLTTGKSNSYNQTLFSKRITGTDKTTLRYSFTKQTSEYATSGYLYNLVVSAENSLVESNLLKFINNKPDDTFSNILKSYTYNGKTVYTAFPFITSSWSDYDEGEITGVSFDDADLIDSSYDIFAMSKILGWALWYGDDISISTGMPNGISDQTDAVSPDLTSATTPAQAKEVLKKTYPNLWDNRIEENVLQTDGTTKTHTYVPVPMPTKGSGKGKDTIVDTQGSKQFAPSRDIETNPHPVITGDISPTSSTDSQIATITKLITTPETITETDPQTGEETQTQTEPQEMVEELPQTQVNPLNPIATTNPTPTGTGDTPKPVTPASVPASLYAIYNPTKAQLDSFAQWLWSDNFVDQIKKLFSDPMQAIIGLHKIYATPVTGSEQNIQVGYIDSGVSSKTVSNQYVTVDCGYINCAEYFGNVFDYSPYTDVKLYLPFIGIVSLDVADIMRSTIEVSYNIDVLTGACLAMVTVTRDNAGGVLYQYAGNASETLPISSGSYMGIVASLASIAGGVATTLASGGGALPLIMGSAGALMNARTNVEHSGGFGGNAGALGIKVPYLIISRPQTALATDYKNFVGNPSNTLTTLSQCTGYVQVKECHLENIEATQRELDEIENLLKSGVLI